MPNSLWSHLFRLSGFQQLAYSLFRMALFDSSRDLWQAASEMAP